MNTSTQNVLTTTLVTAAIASIFIAGDAQAVTQFRSFVQNATGACQAALPSFEGNIRKRLLVVSNDGTSTAVVTCSLMGTDRGIGGQRSLTYALLYVDNNTASPVDVTCTMTDGFSGSGHFYSAKTHTLAANSKLTEYRWEAGTDNGGLGFLENANVSCALPAGTAISITFTYFDEDVGA